MQRTYSLLVLLVANGILAVDASCEEPAVSADNAIYDVVDQRNAGAPLTLSDGDFVAVPIPLSDPTFGTGLIGGAAYFYPQTEAQKSMQPASFTGIAGAYTTNDSWAAGVGQQSYWDGDKWRFNGLAGYVDFKFDLRDPLTGGTELLDWLVDGAVIQGTLYRRLKGDWYAGAQLTYLNITQDIDLDLSEPRYLLGQQIESVGVGGIIEYDSRDVPTNAYKGQRFEAKAIASKAYGDTNAEYQSYFLRHRYYYQTPWPVVIATDVNGCRKSGTFPLWDTCRLALRGFPLTDYLGKTSVYGQAEARWRVHRKLGIVAFAGVGYIGNSLSDGFEDEEVPSAGGGVRYMILESKRINLRIDYAKSEDSDAWYLSVGEAF